MDSFYEARLSVPTLQATRHQLARGRQRRGAGLSLSFRYLGLFGLQMNARAAGFLVCFVVVVFSISSPPSVHLAGIPFSIPFLSNSFYLC